MIFMKVNMQIKRNAFGHFGENTRPTSIIYYRNQEKVAPLEMFYTFLFFI